MKHVHVPRIKKKKKKWKSKEFIGYAGELIYYFKHLFIIHRQY